MRCEVSTFPPATAAGGRAFTTVPAGAITSIGRIRPAVAGTSSCEQATEHVKAGGVRDRLDRVDAAFDLRIAAGEIHRDPGAAQTLSSPLRAGEDSPARSECTVTGPRSSPASRSRHRCRENLPPDSRRAARARRNARIISSE